MRFFICVTIAAAALVGPRSEANAQQPYPIRPITIVVPFAAGGPTDVLARIIGQHMGQTLGQQIVRAWELCLQRRPGRQEQAKLAAHARKHGLASACRVLFNSNEFMFID